MPLSTERFTRLAHTGALSRQPAAGELSDWTGALGPLVDSPAALLAEAGSLVAALFNSAEYTALATSASAYVEDLHLAFFGRVPTSDEQTYWQAQITATSRAAVLALFQVSTEFSTRVASLYAEPSASVPAFPTEELGGPHPSKRRALPPDYKPLVSKHTFEDKGISTNTSGDVPILRWEEDYSDSLLDETEVQILREHYEQARHDELTFAYTDPGGILRTGVRYESYEDDFDKEWIQRARVNLIKYP